MNDSNLGVVYSINHSLKDGDPKKYQVNIMQILDEKNMAHKCISPSDFLGYGECFETALEDYIEQLEVYINTLVQFKKDILDTSKSYIEAKEIKHENHF